MENVKPKTLMDAIKHYADADNALNEVADSRWAMGVTCQHCGAEKPMFLKTRRIWKCSKCRKQFSIKTNLFLRILRSRWTSGSLPLG